MSKMDKILHFLLLLLYLRASDGHQSLQCVQVGQTGTCWPKDGKSCFAGTGAASDVFSIGTKKHQVKNAYALNPILRGKHFSDDDTCQRFPYKGKTKEHYIWVPEGEGADNNVIELPVDLCPEVDIRIYMVKEIIEKTSKEMFLHGWFHVQIQMRQTSDKIKLIYVQMRDEHFNAIGEFVLDENEQCPKSGNGLARPTAHQVFPCSAIASREPKASQAIFMASPDMYTNTNLTKTGVVATEGIEKGVEFTWRLSEYWCNRHRMIRADAYIVTEKQRTGDDAWKYKDALKVPYEQATWRKASHWMKPKWYGAADVMEKIDTVKLDCTTSVLKDSGSLTDDAKEWFISSEQLMAKNDFYGANDPNCDGGVNCACQANPKTQDRTFAGRCEKLAVKNPKTEHTQTCVDDDDDEIEFEGVDFERLKFEKYSAYRNTTYNARMKMCDANAIANCRDPETEKDFEEIKKIRTTQGAAAAEFNKNVSSLPRSDTKKLSLWHGRKFHAMLSVLCSMFLIPVAIFTARYYKETWMSWQSGGVHLWYFVHVGCMIFVICFYAAAYTSMSDNEASWGMSTAPSAVVHRIIGWMTITVFIILLFFGGFRPMNKRIRMGIMTAHSVIGFILHFLNTLLVILSSDIPASPTLDECDEETKLPTGVSVVSILAIVWLVIDLLIFHPVLTVLQFFADKKAGIKRPGWLCPIIPILPGTSHTDFVGAKLRKILLGVYIALAFILTAVTIYLIADKNRDYALIYCDAGNTTCTKPFGCTRFGLVYHKKIMDTIGEDTKDTV